MKEKTLMFIAYEMYFKGLSKEELDNLTGIQLVMELDDFDRWWAEKQKE